MKRKFLGQLLNLKERIPNGGISGIHRDETGWVGLYGSQVDACSLYLGAQGEGQHGHRALFSRLLHTPPYRGSARRQAVGHLFDFMC